VPETIHRLRLRARDLAADELRQELEALGYGLEPEVLDSLLVVATELITKRKSHKWGTSLRTLKGETWNCTWACFGEDALAPPEALCAGGTLSFSRARPAGAWRRWRLPPGPRRRSSASRAS
jgi:hypothetical protein